MQKLSGCHFAQNQKKIICFTVTWFYILCWKAHLSSGTQFYPHFLSEQTGLRSKGSSHLWVEGYCCQKEQKEKTFGHSLSRKAKE